MTHDADSVAHGYAFPPGEADRIIQDMAMGIIDRYHVALINIRKEEIENAYHGKSD